MESGDQTMYLVVQMAQMGMQGGIGALKLTGSAAANVGSLLLVLGKVAGNVLLRQSRLRSSLKHGDIDTTVLTLKHKDKDHIADILKKNGVTGYFVEENNALVRGAGKILGREVDGEKSINLFIRTTDANKAAAALQDLVAFVGRVENVREVPEGAMVIDQRTWEEENAYPYGLNAESIEDVVAEKVNISMEETGHDGEEKNFNERLSEEIVSKRNAASSLIDKEGSADSKPQELAGKREDENNLLTVGAMPDEVSTDPFQKEGCLLGEAKRPEIEGANKDTTPLEAKKQVLQASTETAKLSMGEKSPMRLSQIQGSSPSSITSKKEGPSVVSSPQRGVIDVLYSLKDARAREGKAPSPKKIVEKGREV